MAYGLTQSYDQEAGSSQYSTAADSASLSVTGNLTLEGWLKLETAPTSGNTQTIYDKDTNTGSQRGYWLRYQNVAGTYKFELGISSAGSGRSVATINYTLTEGTWTHVAAVYTAATGGYELFINGSSVGTASGLDTSIFNNTAVFVLGAVLDSGSYSQHFDGRFSLVRVWAEARSGANILANICNVLGAGGNLKAEWTLDNVYTDNSGNSNTLTGVNTPTFAADLPSTCATVAVNSNFLAMM